MSESDECPLCMEVMEIDDLNFFPCSCGYQICRFCWHRIRTDENGLCPACRKAYSENPAMYQPLPKDEIQRIKKERKQREAQRKQKISESRKHLSNVRVIQKNLLFVVGLSQRLADGELLRKPEYFGKYGKILKVIVNPSTNYAGPQGPSASAYVTYSKEEENLRAISAVNNIQQDGRTLRVSLGTTKYCTHFLRNMQCKNPDCMYLHEMGDDNACFTKEDMQQGKHLAYERDLLENFQKTQQQRRKSQDIEQEPQSQPKEDWGQEIAEGGQNSALPARAAWAEKECEKEPDGETLTEDQEEVISPLPSSWRAANDLKEYAETKIEEATFGRRDSVTSSCTPLGSSIPKEILHPTFATGWATSEETKPVSSLPPGITEDKNHSSYMPSFWPINDLGLKNLSVTNDDELGFDPCDEYNKGLAELLATEAKTYGCSTNNEAVASNLGNQSWPESSASSSGFFTQVNKDTSQQYSLFGDTSPGSQPNSFFGSYLNMSSNSNPSPYSAFSPTKPLSSDRSPNRNPFQSKEHDVLAWQDGLRALLPNVNISFSGTKRPPPGFDSPQAQPDEPNSIWTKVGQGDTKVQSPPGITPFPSQTASVKPSTSTAVIPEPVTQQPVTPWNAVVGRAQQGSSQPNPVDLSSAGLPHHIVRPMKDEAVEQSKDPKAAVKPVTTFAKGNAPKSQKPTAKVKPQMKCVVSPLEEPAPVTLQRSNSRGGTMSRMNDLDDISLTDPLPLNRSNSNQGSAGSRAGSQARESVAPSRDSTTIEAVMQAESTKKSSKKKKKNKEKQDVKKNLPPLPAEAGKIAEKDLKGKFEAQRGRKDKMIDKPKEEKMKEPIKIQQRPKPAEPVKPDSKQPKQHPAATVRPDPPKIRILKTDTPSASAVTTMTQSSPMEAVSKGYPGLQEGHEVFSRLAESTEKLLQTVLSETEVIKSNTEQISKDLKTALEKCKESTLSVADWEKINYLLQSPMANGHLKGKQQKPLIDTMDLERQVESARKEAEILEVRLNDVIRKNMASEVETTKKKDGGKRK